MFRTLNHLINPRAHSPDVVAALRARVISEASQFIREIGGTQNVSRYILFRGVSRSTDSYAVRSVPPRRTPVAMNDETERAWTRYISDAGKIAGRRNAVLCTGDIDAAADFGEDKSGRSLSGIVTVIPIGDFHYTWIDGVEDLNIFVWDLDPRQTAQFHNNELPLTVYGDDGTLTDAITSGAEIMITPTSGQYLIVEANLLVAAFP